MVLELGVTEEEHAIVLDLMSALALPNYCAVLSTALFQLATHRAGLKVHPDHFPIGRRIRAVAKPARRAESA